jgi:aminopeptidase N
MRYRNLLTTAMLSFALLSITVIAFAAGEIPEATPDNSCFNSTGSPLIHHNLTIDLYPALNKVEMTDTLYLPEGADELFLNRQYQITGMRSLDGILEYTVEPPDDEADDSVLNRIALDTGTSGPLTILISAQGTFFESTASTSFSHENVGREISITISDEGIYLSGSAGWYPLVGDSPACFKTTITSPDTIECLTNGDLLSHEVSDGRLTSVWQTGPPTDGLILIGGRYHINSRETSGSKTVYTWFLSDDSQLTETYLSQSVRYIEMYSRMLSPYPYQRFTVVENFFPTGYGMPGWTLLGGNIIRLPFIPYTSLGHEILHNWWGNSVFVDDTLGNWCEGITVYQADYLYKLQRDPAEGLRYRKNSLKQFTSYINSENDLPLVEFRERHNPATRAIGYGKSMMLFHMIEEQIGSEAFQLALQDVIASYPYQRASFTAFVHAFSQRSGRDYTHYFDSWLHQLGAIQLAIGKTDWNGTTLTLELLQSEPLFPMLVPVRLTTADGTVDTTLEFSTASASYDIPVENLQQLEIDPDYHLFRFLLPAEMESSLEQAFADTAPYFIPGADTSPETVTIFAEAICDNAEEDHILAPGSPLPRSGTCYLYNPDAIPQGLTTHFTLAKNQVVLNDEVYNLDETTLVLVERRPVVEGLQTIVFVFDESDPEGLGRRLQHYGKYSWLIFQNGRNAGKGYWPVTDSPLSRRW